MRQYLFLLLRHFTGMDIPKLLNYSMLSQLLTQTFGTLAPTLFAIALIAAGQSSTVTGTLAGQIIMEGYLHLRIRPWLRRIITRILAIVPAVWTILYFGEESLGDLLVLSQVVLSLQLGFAIIPLIHFVSDKTRMGKFTIGPWVKLAAWATAVIIVGLNVKLVISSLQDWTKDGGAWYINFLVIPLVIVTGLLLLYIICRPWIYRKPRTTSLTPHQETRVIPTLEVKSFNRIGITVDFSSNDSSSIAYATSQGGKDAEYLLIHVVETAGARVMGHDINDLETQQDITNLQRYAEEMTLQGFKAQVKIGFGGPTKVIPQIVEQFNADLLVMGAHGHRGFKDIIFGTTVDAVRHKVKIPVLIVR